MMKPVLYLRSVVYWLGFVVTTVVVGVLVIAARPLPSDWRLWIARWWGVANLALLKWICGLSYRVEGSGHIIKQKNAIVLCKHQSTWETIALHAIIPGGRWVFKRELLRIPVFGWALACTDPIAIDRSAGRKAVRELVEKGTQKLERGKWVIIFPEGTRTAPGDDSQYKIGGAILAADSGYPVLPVAHNAGEFWPKHSFIKYPGCITVRIGDYIDTQDKKAAEILRETRDWIEAQMQDIADPARWYRVKKPGAPAEKQA